MNLIDLSHYLTIHTKIISLRLRNCVNNRKKQQRKNIKRVHKINVKE